MHALQPQHGMSAYSWQGHVQQGSNTHHLSMRNASPLVDPGPAARAQHSGRLPQTLRWSDLLTFCFFLPGCFCRLCKDCRLGEKALSELVDWGAWAVQPAHKPVVLLSILLQSLLTLVVPL